MLTKLNVKSTEKPWTELGSIYPVYSNVELFPVQS